MADSTSQNINSENLNIQQGNVGESANKNLLSKLSQISNKVKLATALGLLVVIVLIAFVLVKSGGDRYTKAEEELIAQNDRLNNLPEAATLDPEDEFLIEARKKILDYAEKNNITVNEQEIAERKTYLIELNGQDSINNTLTEYQWTEDDWTEVIRWQLLREKILEFIRPSRSGEVISVRWDVYSPELNEEIAAEKSVVAKEYLEKVRTQLLNDEIVDVYEVQSGFDISEEPIFEGHENEYALQYQGKDEETKIYSEFIMTKESPDYVRIMSTQPPEVTEINCTLGGCTMYNVISGTNGDESASEILSLLTEEEIFF